MSEWLHLIASVEWIALGIICFRVLRKWNKKFAALHDEMQATFSGCNEERTCETCYANDMDVHEIGNPCWNCKGNHSEWMPKEGATHD